MENHHLEWIFQWKTVIFHIFSCLPEGNLHSKRNSYWNHQEIWDISRTRRPGGLTHPVSLTIVRWEHPNMKNTKKYARKRERERDIYIYIYIYIHTYTHIYILYIYICICIYIYIHKKIPSDFALFIWFSYFFVATTEWIFSTPRFPRRCRWWDRRPQSCFFLCVASSNTYITVCYGRCPLNPVEFIAMGKLVNILVFGVYRWKPTLNTYLYGYLDRKSSRNYFCRRCCFFPMGVEVMLGHLPDWCNLLGPRWGLGLKFPELPFTTP